MASKRQIEGNRQNWAKRRGLTPTGRERLRWAALRNRPWQYSTGPRTVEGKRRSRMNAWKHGECDAVTRAQLAMVGAIERVWRRLADGSEEDVARAFRQAQHELPADLNTTTATAWLREHRRLGRST